ncbi:MAG: T9SS type A sorting domain-containing protein, partial [Cytophagales bacterium]|nr:T9SS type A sorting domain-containing protein [Cytophagales bacterium]
NLGFDTIICTGDSIVLDAGNPGMQYSWSTPDTTQTITVDTSGTYSVQVTDVTGCFSSDTVSVTVSSGPTAVFTTTISGLTVFFDATFSVDATSGFFWDFGDGAGTSTQDTVTYTYAAAGTYPVMLRAFNPCGSDSFLISVTVTSTGIAEIAIATGQINIYPNPNEGVFTVSFTGFENEKIQLTILDLQGRSVVNEQHSVNSEFNKEVDLSRQPKGMYFLRVNTSDNVFIKKVFVQ